MEQKSNYKKKSERKKKKKRKTCSQSLRTLAFYRHRRFPKLPQEGRGEDFSREENETAVDVQQPPQILATKMAHLCQLTQTEHGKLSWSAHLGTARNKDGVFDGQSTGIPAMAPQPSSPQEPHQPTWSLARPQNFSGWSHRKELTATSRAQGSPRNPSQARSLSGSSHYPLYQTCPCPAIGDRTYPCQLCV